MTNIPGVLVYQSLFTGVSVCCLLRSSMKEDSVMEGTPSLSLPNLASSPKSLKSAKGPPGSNKPRYVIGVCAMECKSRSKPMRNILDRLLASNSLPGNPVSFEIIIFTEKMILDENIDNWPNCDGLICFYSTGFPLDKAIEYAKSRGIFCVNDLVLQEVLMDRRVVQLILEAIDVPTPKRLWLNRDEGPPAGKSAELVEIVSRDFNVDISASELYKNLPLNSTQDSEVIRIGRKQLKKPFVEKPVSSDDHNIYIYHAGGGVRRLFRKIANKCSDFVENVKDLRPQTDIESKDSFIYEEFMPVDNGEDIKVYTVGPYYAYAESRKSPFIDGIVRRNAQGKEMRTVTPLTEEEQEIARRVCMAFGQTVCGFDMIRSGGRPYVIDVNGWSFVKGSDMYYDKCAKILRETFIQVAKRKIKQQGLPIPSVVGSLEYANQWRLKAYVAVFRHADRTPKQKLKLLTDREEFLKYFDEYPTKSSEDTEITVRNREDLHDILNICNEILAKESDDQDTPRESIRLLRQMQQVLVKKVKIPGTKLQFRPINNPEKRTLLLILKWGGEFTHAGRHQSKDCGENLRKDLVILNKRALDDVRVFSSTERRVVATAEVFTKAFFPMAELPVKFINVDKKLLDDNTVEKAQVDSVKARIKETFLKDDIVQEVLTRLRQHREFFKENYTNFDPESDNRRWCCSESPVLFKERWDKHFKDVLDAADIEMSRFSDLYDSIRYDAIHHRSFLLQMFVGNVNDNDDCYEERLTSFHKLFDQLHELFGVLNPLEYGFDADERLNISLQIAGKLLKRILEDLDEAEQADEPTSRLYFTKETHILALLNIIKYSGIPLKRKSAMTGGGHSRSVSLMSADDRGNAGNIFSPFVTSPIDFSSVTTSIPTTANPILSDETEMDYLSQLCFEFYEKFDPSTMSRSYSLRIALSSGAHYPHLFDLQLDAKHAVTVGTRKWITEYLDAGEIRQWLRRLF